MDRETVHQLVADKNKELERSALRSAEEIINNIASEQGKIEQSQKRLAELRKELKELEVKQIDAKAILGES